MIRMRLCCNRGFMLAEVMMAMTLIAVALVAVAYMFIISTEAKAAAAGEAAAAALAQKQVELLKGQGPAYWTAAANGSYLAWQGNGDGAVQNGDSWTVTVNQARYGVTTQVQACQENSNLAQVVVTVAWTEMHMQGGAVRMLPITAFYSKF